MSIPVAKIRAIVSLPKETTAALDERLAQQWHGGQLSTRQSAGFYEVTPERYPALMALYRERIKLIVRAAKWRRAHQEPSGEHFALLDAKRRVVDIVRDMPRDWADFHEAKRRWQSMNKTERKRADLIAEPVAPGGPTPEHHDRYMVTYVYGPSKVGCPGCAQAKLVVDRWLKGWLELHDTLGVDRPSNTNWHGNDVGVYPDGSYRGGLFNYPPLPIRSSKAVPRDRKLAKEKAA